LPCNVNYWYFWQVRISAASFVVYSDTNYNIHCYWLHLIHANEFLEIVIENKHSPIVSTAAIFLTHCLLDVTRCNLCYCYL